MWQINEPLYSILRNIDRTKLLYYFVYATLLNGIRSKQKAITTNMVSALKSQRACLTTRFEHGEPRWQSVGMVDGFLLLLLAHTVHDRDDGIEVVRIISARHPTKQEKNAMNRVSFKSGSLPPLTPAQRKELKALAKLPDSTIDTSDIQPLSATRWAQAVQGRFYKPIKTATTVRVDADVLAWLKSDGKGYQTRINGILRDAMMQSLKLR